VLFCKTWFVFADLLLRTKPWTNRHWPTGLHPGSMFGGFLLAGRFQAGVFRAYPAFSSIHYTANLWGLLERMMISPGLAVRHRDWAFLGLGGEINAQIEGRAKPKRGYSKGKNTEPARAGSLGEIR